MNLFLNYFIERYFLKSFVSNFHASLKLISPKSVAHFFPKSVADFPKVCGSFFPKVRGSFSQSRWFIFPKSVAHFPKVGDGFSPNSVVESPNCLQVSNCFDLFHAHGFSSQSRVSESLLICDETTQTSFGCIHVYNYL